MRKVLAHIIGLPLAIAAWLLAMLPAMYVIIVAYIAGVKGHEKVQR